MNAQKITAILMSIGIFFVIVAALSLLGMKVLILIAFLVILLSGISILIGSAFDL